MRSTMNKLLIFLISTSTLNVALADQSEKATKDMIEAIKTCNAMLNIPSELPKPESSNLSPETKACLIECALERIGVIKNGKFLLEGMKYLEKFATGENKMEPAKVKSLHKICTAKVEKYRNTKCPNGKGFMSCMGIRIWAS